MYIHEAQLPVFGAMNPNLATAYAPSSASNPLPTTGTYVKPTTPTITPVSAPPTPVSLDCPPYECPDCPENPPALFDCPSCPDLTDYVLKTDTAGGLKWWWLLVAGAGGLVIGAGAALAFAKKTP